MDIKLLKDSLVCFVLFSLSWFFLSLVVLVRDADITVKALPGEIASTRRELLATVNTQATILQQTVDARLGSIQQTVDARTTQAIQITDSRMAEVTTQVAKVQADLHPVLLNMASLTKDAQDSWDDLYPDIKAATESATVVITSTALASEAMRDAAPRVAASVVEVSKSAEGIANDIKRGTDAITKPVPWYTKVLNSLYTVGRVLVLMK